MPTFTETLAGSAPDRSKLEAYLASLGTEWLKSENKAAASDIDFGARKTVAAFANAQGGELFIGVTDKSAVVGSDLDVQQIQQRLRQSTAPRQTWYEVDLTQPVARVIPVPLETPSKTAYVVEVRRFGLPVFVLDESTGELQLYIRHGGSSEKQNAFQAIEWSQLTGREEILRTCYLELKTLGSRVDWDWQLPVGFVSNLPYLMKRLEDGSFYTLLDPDDRRSLLGEASPGGMGYANGFLSNYLNLGYKVDRESKLLASLGKDRHATWLALRALLQQEIQSIKQDVDSFKKYLERERIASD